MKIGVPLNGDTVSLVGMSCVAFMIIGLCFGFGTYALFTSYWYFAPMFYVMGYVLLALPMMAFNKDEWIDKVYPFEFTK